MNVTRVYDAPTRVFHWCFAACFIAAYTIASSVDDESSRFAWHMLAGAMLTVSVLLRAVWGVVGTRHARFGDFTLDPRQLRLYLKGVLSGGGHSWAGHNPASSWAALSMMALGLGLGVSGVAMVAGVAPGWVKEAHELAANTFLAIVLLHVAGVLVHGLRHRDALPLSMLNGHKRGLPDATPAVPARGVVALVFLLVVAGTGVSLSRQYDAANGTLAVFGTPLTLVENEAGSQDADAREGTADEEENEEAEEH